MGSIPGSGKSPGVGNGNPPQYSCLENPHGERSLVGYSPWGRKESDTTEVTQHAWMLTLEIPMFYIDYIRWQINNFYSVVDHITYMHICVLKKTLKSYQLITYVYQGKKVYLFLFMLVISSTLMKFYIMAIWYGFLIRIMIQLDLIRKISYYH